MNQPDSSPQLSRRMLLRCLGAAFAAARAGMLRDTLARQQMLDEDDQKTLLEFVLYGDPTIVVGS